MIRFFDLLISITGILIFSPVILIISLIIPVESKGGVFFTQPRVGKNGKIFTIYKFRTMVINYPKKLLLTTDNDTRITRMGLFLRSKKLDELPQLFNVIKGEMSIVGPRPEVPEYVNYYSPEQKEILKVKPGITDLASIEFSNESELLTELDNPEKYYIENIIPQKIDLNMEYIRNRSLKNYFRIIFQTLKTILK
ncbi:MAG: sugar transferase [bacterium]